MERDVVRGDFDRAFPAKPIDFECCNACHYPFAKRDGVIDMKDFREHKEACQLRSGH